MAEFTEFLKAKNLAGRTIQQYLTYTKMFLKFAGHPVEFSYYLPHEERKANKRKQLQRWFTEEDVVKCLKYRFPKYDTTKALQYRVIVRLLAETGARVRELSHITAENIDFKHNIVWLMDSKTEPRPAFFSPLTNKLLRQMRSGSLLWNGNRFPMVERIKQIINAMLVDVGLKAPNDGRGAHTFRHYVATKLFYEGNMRIEDVSTLLGTTVDVVVGHYLHPTPLMLKKRVDKAMGWK